MARLGRGKVIPVSVLRLDRLATAPGRKLLVLGNHDFTRRGKVAHTGFDEAWMTLLVATDPPLAFTHTRYETCRPAPSTSTGTSTTTSRYAPAATSNICVEHTDYRPLPLQAIVRLAAELVDGRTAAGETTIDRLRAIGALG